LPATSVRRERDTALANSASNRAEHRMDFGILAGEQQRSAKGHCLLVMVQCTKIRAM
jgi:hypothetical protein